MGKTGIEWASHTVNFYTWNCTKVSPGCKNCYAATLAERQNGRNSHGGEFTGAPVMRPTVWKELRSKTALPPGSVAFINSMSDTFHEGATVQMIHSIFNAAAYIRPDVTFLVLTKRPDRAYAMRHTLPWPENLWLGTSVENADYLWRLDYLLEIPAAGHFVSAEPLLGSPHGLEYYLPQPVTSWAHRPGQHLTYGQFKSALRWVIAGAESGGNRRPFNPDWVREIRDMCIRTGTPFMFKQGSAFKPGQNRLLDGRTWSETPFADQTEPEPEAPRSTVRQLSMF